MNELKLNKAVSELYDELERALKSYPPFNTQHEGYAVIKEELDELWEEIRKKPTVRSKKRMREEAIQVAAMGIRFALDICEEENETHP